MPHVSQVVALGSTLSHRFYQSEGRAAGPDESRADDPAEELDETKVRGVDGMGHYGMKG